MLAPVSTPTIIISSGITIPAGNSLQGHRAPDVTEGQTGSPGVVRSRARVRTCSLVLPDVSPCPTRRVPVRPSAPWGLGVSTPLTPPIPSLSSSFSGHISRVRRCLHTTGLGPKLVQSMFVNQSLASPIWLATGNLGQEWGLEPSPWPLVPKTQLWLQAAIIPATCSGSFWGEQGLGPHPLRGALD